MRKPLVLLGTGTSVRNAPLRDPQFDFWGPAYVAPIAPHLSLAFEIHDRDTCERERVWDGMKTLRVPVLMFPPHAEIPTSVSYPLEQVADRFTPAGRTKPYLTSVADYMLAYALLLEEPPPSIALYGLDMSTGGEYELQQRGCEWWLGILFGRGIPFTLAPTSDMLKTRFLYGIEERQRDAEVADLCESLAWFQLKREQAEGAQQTAFGQAQQIRGRIAQIERELRASRR